MPLKSQAIAKRNGVLSRQRNRVLSPNSSVIPERIESYYLLDNGFTHAILEQIPWRSPSRMLNSIHTLLNSIMKIKAIIHEAQEGGYWAEVPALPGCITEGESWEEVMDNLQEAIMGWLEVANESSPIQETDRIVEIAV
nr:type II toxin-antitoxin system HicB family antitoxin [Roseofilum sp. Guam]